MGECLFATFSAPEKARIDKDDEVVVTLQGETLRKNPHAGWNPAKNHFFQKANIVRKMDFYKDKSLFLCQYQLFIVLLHRVCAELPVMAG